MCSSDIRVWGISIGCNKQTLSSSLIPIINITERKKRKHKKEIIHINKQKQRQRVITRNTNVQKPRDGYYNNNGYNNIEKRMYKKKKNTYAQWTWHSRTKTKTRRINAKQNANRKRWKRNRTKTKTRTQMS